MLSSGPAAEGTLPIQEDQPWQGKDVFKKEEFNT